MPDDLASLFSLIFFLRDVFGFIIILPRDWISEKISACIRHIKRITQRSRLLPDLKETVLQLWKLIPLYSEQRGFEGKVPFLRACCLQLVKVMGEPLLGAYAPALKEHFGLLHKAVPQSTVQHMGTPCNSSPGLCLLRAWHAVFVCPSEARSSSLSDVHCRGTPVLQCLSCPPLVFLWNPSLVSLLACTVKKCKQWL